MRISYVKNHWLHCFVPVFSAVFCLESETNKEMLFISEVGELPVLWGVVCVYGRRDRGIEILFFFFYSTVVKRVNRDSRDSLTTAVTQHTYFVTWEQCE